MRIKKIFCLILLLPVLLKAQNKVRFENDTLYTSCGYKIYVGQTLQFGKAGGKDGKFNFIEVRNGANPNSLENNSIIVKELGNFDSVSYLNTNIDVTGYINFKDGSKGYMDIHLNFEYAIGNLNGINGELIVPEAFRTGKKMGNLLYIPRFEKDTLYTSCGYKIYKDQLLQFGTTTGDRDRFRYINIKTRTLPTMLQNHAIRVTALSDFGLSRLGNAYITVKGILIINNNERGDIEIHMAFDHAIENLPGIPSELVVPDKFRSRMTVSPEPEVERLFKLYRNGTITGDMFELQKKWLLGR